MKDFFQILRRFVPPYKGYLASHILMTILSALLTLVSFASIQPILKILFKIDETIYTDYQTFHFHFFSISSWQESMKAIENNCYVYITENIQIHGGTYVLMLLGIFLVATTFLRTATMYLSIYLMIPLRTGVVRDIRNQINAKILALPLAFFSEERKGDILARVSGDVNEIETSIMSSLDMLFKNPILIVIYLSGMFFISWQLTLFVLFMLPVAGFVMGQIGKKLKQRSTLGQQQWGLLMSQIEETLSGLRIIKAFNAEKKISERFHKGNEDFRRTTKRIVRRQQMSGPMSEFLGTITISIVLWYGGSLILSDHSSIDAAGFMNYLVIFYLLINPAKELSKSIYSIQKGLASMDRVDKILKAESTITDPEQPVPIAFRDK
ncbi:MAG: ABC transporter ATP-binding protein, partial [Dysgonamonadaceae bacterium]|nr:ABC transporter ATP-binding protein [Dysgonamonadaceae bacterium]